MDARFEAVTEAACVRFDSRSGAGSMPDNEEVGHLGFAAMMKPSVYLDLVGRPDHPERMRASFERLDAAQSAGGRGFGQPTLRLAPVDGSFTVVGQEGRHRMLWILERSVDTEVPVHVFVRNLKAGRISPGLLEAIRDGALTEDGCAVRGPLFGDALLQGVLHTAPVPPPGPR